MLRAQVTALWVTAVIQGIALVTMPTISTVLTDPHHYGLSQAAYGALFVPQTLVAIVTSLAGSALTQRFGAKRLYQVGLAADLVSMIVLVASQFVVADRALAYTLLLVTTAFLGVGFALTAPALIVIAAGFFPRAVDRTVLTANALLGGGPALAPLLLLLFVGLGFWWGLPAVVGAAMLALLLASTRLGLSPPAAQAAAPKGAAARRPRPGLPPAFWVFAGFSVLYGICEQMDGTWAPLYLHEHFGAASATATLALTAFWALCAVGRLGSGLLDRWIPETLTFVVLPFVLAGSFLMLTLLPRGSSPWLGGLAYCVAGLGVSALFPLDVGFAEESLAQIAAGATSLVFAFYLIGFGLAAFGAGPLHEAGISFEAMYAWSAAIALAVAALAFVIVALLLGARRAAATVKGTP